LLVRNIPAVADIRTALTQNPDAYTLSLGHMRDLTLASFAYLKLPLLLAGVALLVGAVGSWRYAAPRALLALALMMLLFVQAARMALVVFDPYLSSRPLAESLLQAPPGEMIVDPEYYAFSSVFFYEDRTGWLLNGRVNQVEYGSHAPGAPDVFLDDVGLESLWRSQRRYYLLATGEAVPRLRSLLGQEALRTVKESGGKFLFTNHPLH